MPVVLVCNNACGQVPAFKPGEIVIVPMYGKQEEAQVVRTDAAGVTVRQKDWQDGTYKADGPTRHYNFADVTRKQTANAAVGTSAPAPAAIPAPASNAATNPEPDRPMSKQEIIDYLKTRIGTDSPHPQKETVNLALRELIKKRGVSFRYDSAEMHEFTKVGGARMLSDAMQANFGTPKPMSWLVGEWNVSTTATRTFNLGNAVNKMGFLVIEEGGKFLWKIKADDEAKNWIDGKWRAATAEEMNWMGGAGVVLQGGEQGYDWIVYRDYTSDDGKDWITISIINSRQTFRNGQRAP